MTTRNNPLAGDVTWTSNGRRTTRAEEIGELLEELVVGEVVVGVGGQFTASKTGVGISDWSTVTKSARKTPPPEFPATDCEKAVEVTAMRPSVCCPTETLTHDMSGVAFKGCKHSNSSQSATGRTSHNFTMRYSAKKKPLVQQTF